MGDCDEWFFHDDAGVGVDGFGGDWLGASERLGGGGWVGFVATGQESGGGQNRYRSFYLTVHSVSSITDYSELWIK
jgi:hypothetical protein